jgi:hypothetical protein
MAAVSGMSGLIGEACETSKKGDITSYGGRGGSSEPLKKKFRGVVRISQIGIPLSRSLDRSTSSARVANHMK